MLLIAIISSDDLNATLYDTGNEEELVVHDILPETAKQVSLSIVTLVILGRPMNTPNKCNRL